MLPETCAAFSFRTRSWHASAGLTAGLNLARRVTLPTLVILLTGAHVDRIARAARPVGACYTAAHTLSASVTALAMTAPLT